METILDAALELGAVDSKRGSDTEKVLELENRIVVHVDSELRSLQDRVTDLEGRSGSQCYKFGHDNFWNSDDDLEYWITTNEIPSCGVFWDLFSALVAIDGGKKPTGKELADTNFSASRTKTTPFENDLVASMSHDLPGVFSTKLQMAFWLRKKRASPSVNRMINGWGPRPTSHTSRSFTNACGTLFQAFAGPCNWVQELGIL